MLEKLRAALGRVADALVRDKTLLARARKRAKKFRERAEHNHTEALKAERQADALRVAADRYLHYDDRQDQPRGEALLYEARAKDRKAARCHARAFNSSQKAIWWRGRIKTILQRIHKLETRREDLEAQVRKLDQVTIKGNTATGGTPQERLKAVALQSAANCAAGKRANFYSQPGRYTVDKCLTGESSGERSDCSQWFSSVYKSCGLDDPNGQGWGWGYTGTLEQHGKQISTPEIGCAVLYGSPGRTHHVEEYIGEGRTIGHGSAPIDAGVVDLFGDGNYRYFKFV